jgi:hypothetical protein
MQNRDRETFTVGRGRYSITRDRRRPGVTVLNISLGGHPLGQVRKIHDNGTEQHCWQGFLARGGLVYGGGSGCFRVGSMAEAIEAVTGHAAAFSDRIHEIGLWEDNRDYARRSHR